MEVYSRRTYLIVFIESGYPHVVNATLSDILSTNSNGSDFEFKYAMQDNIDKILDLKPYERFLMKFNRDNKDSDGFIYRLN